jgi:hypothetical protein
MVRQAQLVYCVYHRLHVSTYLKVIFRPLDKIVRNCYAYWDPIMLAGVKYVKYIKYIIQ